MLAQAPQTHTAAPQRALVTDISGVAVCSMLSMVRRAQVAGGALVVVDFYKTSCGACKYLLPGFTKICQSAYDRSEHPNVIFLKHNVFDDEEEEKTDLARRLHIQNVPAFKLFREMEVRHGRARDTLRRACCCAHLLIKCMPPDWTSVNKGA
jgi:thiol-disulfide isomerase/thioredoxin